MISEDLTSHIREATIFMCNKIFILEGGTLLPKREETISVCDKFSILEDGSLLMLILEDGSLHYQKGNQTADHACFKTNKVLRFSLF